MSTVAELMLFNAMCAIALAWIYAAEQVTRDSLGHGDMVLSMRLRAMSAGEHTYTLIRNAVPLVFPLLGAILVNRFKHNGGRWRRVMREPGAVASLAAVMYLVFLMCNRCIVTTRLIVTYGGRLEASDHYYHFAAWKTLIPVCEPSEIGLAVAAAWLVLCASGRWTASGAWSDRLGRAVGMVWIAWYFVQAAVPWWPNGD